MSYQHMVEVLAPLNESTRRQVIQEHWQTVFSSGFIDFICDSLTRNHDGLTSLQAQMLPGPISEMSAGIKIPETGIQIDDFETIRDSMNIVWKGLREQQGSALRSQTITPQVHG